MRGSVYKRCQCEVQHNAKGDRLACKKEHGSWYYNIEYAVRGKRKQVRKGGPRPAPPRSRR